MATSGTYAFSPSLADIVLDAFDRIQIRPAALTVDHMASARRSLNQIFVRYANRGLNLWAIDEQVVTLNNGQYNYAVPNSTVMMLETWVRQYQMGAVEDVTPSITTTLGSASVVVTLADNGLVAGLWTAIPIYTSVGGIILQGFYTVDSCTTNTFTITADSVATASVVAGGAVPVYDSTINDETILVTLSAHGFLPGETYTVHVQTTVGGISLLGDYTILTTPTANTLTFDALNPAGSTETVSENTGLMEISTQSAQNLPVDTFMTPISRTDWAALSIKNQPTSLPTTYYFDRTSPPTVNIWGTPNLTNSPMELHYFRMRQLQDANPQGTQTPDIPYRFEEVLCADLAFMLAMKWKQDIAPALKDYAAECWAEAASEDRERVILSLAPQMDNLYS